MDQADASADGLADEPGPGADRPVLHGLRASELAGLRLDDLNLAQFRIWVHRLRTASPTISRLMAKNSGGNRGVDQRVLQDYLGYRNPVHTAHYSRVSGGRFEKLWRK